MIFPDQPRKLKGSARDFYAADRFPDFERVIVRDTYGLIGNLIRGEHFLNEGGTGGSAAHDHDAFPINFCPRKVISDDDEDPFEKSRHNGKIEEEYTVYKGRTYTDISPTCKDGKNDICRSDADDRKRLFQSVDNSDRRKHNSVHAEQPEK